MPTPPSYAVFETASGFAAIGWNRVGVVGFRLPASRAASAERAVLQRFPDAVRAEPPQAVAGVIAATQRYFTGEPVDFTSVPVDLGEQEPLFDRIYAYVRGLHWGQATTYGAVAKALGEGPEAARTVGQAMASNPVPLIIPCHRVTAANGKIGGFSAPGGSLSKIHMLELEGVTVTPENPPKKAAVADTQIGFDF